MRTRTSGTEDRRLKSVCGTGGVAFLVIILLSVLIERTAIAGDLIGAGIVLGALTIYALAGVMSRTTSLSDYVLAGRSVPAVFAGIAAAAEWTAPAIILSAVGSLLLTGAGGHAPLLALTAGYVLAAVLIAPFLRNSGASTIPDFMAARFGGLARFLAVIVLIACSLPLLVALVQAAALLIARGLDLSTDTALYAVIAMIALCTLPGGLRGVTATQVAQYVVLMIGAVALFVIVEAQRFDVPAGESYDALVLALRALARGTGLSPSLSPRSIPFSVAETVNNLELVLCLMAGTASLPHILLRSASTSDAAQARATTVWTLLFIALLVLMLPTFFALAADAAGRDQNDVLLGLVVILGLTAMLAAASHVTLTLANSLGHDVFYKALAPGAGPTARLVAARAMLVAVIICAAYGAASLPPEPLSMIAWAFSLAAAGYFPALVLGIWWQRTTAMAATCGMVAGFGLALFYLVVSRYFPLAGVTRFGMSSLLDPATGQPLVNVGQALADPRWLADMPAGLTNPLASKVGWLNVSNLACGIFGMPVGFLTIIALSLMAKRPTGKPQAAIGALRTPANARKPERAA